jgi:hypothetical protein
VSLYSAILGKEFGIQRVSHRVGAREVFGFETFTEEDACWFSIVATTFLLRELVPIEGDSARRRFGQNDATFAWHEPIGPHGLPITCIDVVEGASAVDSFVRLIFAIVAEVIHDILLY